MTPLRILLPILIIIGLVAVLCTMAGSFILDTVSHKALDFAVHYAKGKGVFLMDPRFESVYFSGPQTLTVKNFMVDVIPMKATRLTDPGFFLYLREASVSWSNSALTVRLKEPLVRTAEKIRSEKNIMTARAEFRGEDATIVVPIGLWHPRSYINSFRYVRGEIKKVCVLGHTSLPVELKGNMSFMIGKIPVSSTIIAEKRGKQYFFLMEEKVVRELARRLDEKITNTEVRFIADHAIQAARLLRIKNYAKRTAAAEHKKHPEISEDAYRHILWSFHLTREFGAQFAKKVTDAHEIGDQDEDNTEADHLMDYHNNAIGVQYALKGVQENKILSLIKTDRNVILAPQFVSSYRE